MPSKPSQPRWLELNTVGTEVHNRVQKWQEGILADRSADVAALARLRRGLGKEPGKVNDILQYTLSDKFTGKNPGDGPTTAETAAHVSMTLYALHQQSKGKRMHQRGWGMGRSVGGLIPEKARDDASLPSDPIVRRFQAMGTADSLDELVHHARGMVQLLRTKQIPLDYGLLADELVEWQHPARISTVRLRWARDFYRSPAPDTSN